MPGRPKRRARLASQGVVDTSLDRRRAERALRTGRAATRSSDSGCPPRHATHWIEGRRVCTDRGVTEWLVTGRGFSDGFTRGGSPQQNLADLTRAIRRHIQLERQDPVHNARHGMESKYETRSLIEDDPYGQGLWLWLNTHVRAEGIYPKDCISVTIDHG